jgi:hypothetical protein
MSGLIAAVISALVGLLAGLWWQGVLADLRARGGPDRRPGLPGRVMAACRGGAAPMPCASCASQPRGLEGGAMNLAVKDIRANLARFLLTGLGVGLTLLAAMSMTGLYHGIVADALAIIDDSGADLWVIQAGTEGPLPRALR